MDLSNLGLSELHAFAQQVKVEIKRREGEEVARARQQILAIAQSVGIPLKDLLAGSGKVVGNPNHGLSGKRVAVKFRHPEDASLAWTGRGVKPKWVVAWLDACGTMDQLRVNA